ncbi:hypothetical protein [methanotrophic endosymbiont of Bathymodiolus puteoserpentis (Logatchev)]|jgi:large-conductance mechanosensitive channel|uniref:hypothetical protein n=1 Tax=methanotrophic endosymbiont of Bathymodiolus puteoserpentis (Logatchev) TaxID=343235 RepID=UPI00157AAE3A|nr:hypothetical protein [methanotrophic endosymbiont of Bathymodiolus puteoserpentis (Logatchev)]
MKKIIILVLFVMSNFMFISGVQANGVQAVGTESFGSEYALTENNEEFIAHANNELSGFILGFIALAFAVFFLIKKHEEISKKHQDLIRKH